MPNNIVNDLPIWIDVALKEIGVNELAGPLHNPRILEYHQATALKSTQDETPWCSAFVNWVMKQCGYLGTDSAAARSWLSYGKRLDEFEKYSIVVLQRGKNQWQGHVGFAMDEDGAFIKVLGGNQNNKVSIASYPKGRVLGYQRITDNLKDDRKTHG